jgi:hypothetical protein
MLFPFSFMQSQGQPLLLDLYPNAAVAFSVRKLRTAYSGSAIRVRRSSDNAEQDIGFVSGYLDTTSLLSFCGGASGFVTTWYDQSGNGKNAVQTTASIQPRIASFGVLQTLTGVGTPKACINFEGSQWFQYSSSVSVPNCSYFSAYNVEQKGVSIISLWSAPNGGSSGGSPFTPLSYSDNNSYITSTLISSGGNGAQYSTSTPSPDPNPSIYRIYSGYSKMNPNTQLYSNNNPINLVLGGLEVNNNNFDFLGRRTTGEISTTKAQEHIIWLSNQQADQTLINDNVNTFYGIY